MTGLLLSYVSKLLKSALSQQIGFARRSQNRFKNFTLKNSSVLLFVHFEAIIHRGFLLLNFRTTCGRYKYKATPI